MYAVLTSFFELYGIGPQDHESTVYGICRSLSHGKRYCQNDPTFRFAKSLSVCWWNAHVLEMLYRRIVVNVLAMDQLHTLI
jgi:hypothetical protein